jgi:hypothetical protein
MADESIQDTRFRALNERKAELVVRVREMCLELAKIDHEIIKAGGVVSGPIGGTIGGTIGVESGEVHKQ